MIHWGWLLLAFTAGIAAGGFTLALLRNSGGD